VKATMRQLIATETKPIPDIELTPIDVRTTLLWGRSLAPERYDLARWLFLRGLGVIYFAAFASLDLDPEDRAVLASAERSRLTAFRCGPKRGRSSMRYAAR
jgi:hypothetical protein